MSDDQFTRLFKYMQTFDERLTKTEDNMATKADIDRVLATLDSYASKIDDYAMEMAAMHHATQN